MLRIIACKFFIFFVVFALTILTTFGQDSAPSNEAKKASIKFTAQVEINGKTERLDRKRFYLIRGSRRQNSALLEKIAAEMFVSRDCYFAEMRRAGKKISDEYLCWLKLNDCESAYCREVKTPEEALAVPEFAAAYRQGIKEYKQPFLALKWLPTNLSDEIRNGFYERQKPFLEQIVALAKTSALETTKAKRGAGNLGDGFQTIMTDRLGGAYFLDIDIAPPEGKKTETYLVTNLTPTFFGDTGYVWTCEIEIDPSKPQFPFVLKSEIGKKKCDVVTKKQPENCILPECAKAAEKTATN